MRRFICASMVLAATMMTAGCKDADEGSVEIRRQGAEAVRLYAQSFKHAPLSAQQYRQLKQQSEAATDLSARLQVASQLAQTEQDARRTRLEQAGKILDSSIAVQSNVVGVKAVNLLSLGAVHCSLAMEKIERTLALEPRLVSLLWGCDDEQSRAEVLSSEVRALEAMAGSGLTERLAEQAVQLRTRLQQLDKTLAALRSKRQAVLQSVEQLKSQAAQAAHQAEQLQPVITSQHGDQRLATAEKAARLQLQASRLNHQASRWKIQAEQLQQRADDLTQQRQLLAASLAVTDAQQRACSARAQALRSGQITSKKYMLAEIAKHRELVRKQIAELAAEYAELLSQASEQLDAAAKAYRDAGEEMLRRASHARQVVSEKYEGKSSEYFDALQQIEDQAHAKLLEASTWMQLGLILYRHGALYSSAARISRWLQGRGGDAGPNPQLLKDPEQLDAQAGGLYSRAQEVLETALKSYAAAAKLYQRSERLRELQHQFKSADVIPKGRSLCYLTLADIHAHKNPPDPAAAEQFRQKARQEMMQKPRG